MESTVEPIITSTDVMVACPFNADHVLISHRMPGHIVRCQRKYQGPALVICPYNAMHRVPAEAMDSHLVECEDRLKNILPVPVEQATPQE